MLTYHVQDVRTAAYVQRSRNDEVTLSVSGTQQVTLHCAGDLKSDPFPFDSVVYAPFAAGLYAACLSETVKAQFGAAVQRGGGPPASARRRSTLLHGDPPLHVSKAFHEMVRLAAEDVERIAGAGHAGSPYECVFNVVRVFPWGEVDLLGEALRQGGTSLPPSAAVPAAGAAAPLWHSKTTVPLHTPEQRRLFLRLLREVSEVPAAGERNESAACVSQVRLAVYATGGGAAVKALCAEHLFSLVPSVSDVCRSFGTSMELLCEVLVCRHEGNLLDNPLLPVLLPSAATEGVSVITCISARGQYASRRCIDACCFGCSGDREGRVALLMAPDDVCEPVKVQDRVGTHHSLLCTPVAHRFSHARKANIELLLSRGQRGDVISPQRRGSPQRTALGASWRGPTHVPSAAEEGAVGTPERRSGSPLAYLDASVDRLLAHHRLPTSPPAHRSTAETTPSKTPPPRRPLQSRSPFNTYDLRKHKERAVWQAEQMLLQRVSEAEESAEAAMRAAREKTAEARRLEAEAREQLDQMRHGHATEEASLLIRQKVLELSCAELAAKEERLKTAVGERRGAAEALARAAEQLAVVEPRLHAMQAEQQRTAACAALQQRWCGVVDATCEAYATAVAAKVAALDASARAVADAVRLDAWETELSRLRRQCAAEAQRLAVLEGKSGAQQRRVAELAQAEAGLRATLAAGQEECARLERAAALMEEQREATQRQIASDLREAADAQEKALRDYDAGIAVLTRLKGEVEELRRVRSEEQAKSDAARCELAALRCELEKYEADRHAAEEQTQERFAALAETVALGEEEKASLEAQLSSLRADVADLQTTRDALSKELEELRAAQAAETEGVVGTGAGATDASAQSDCRTGEAEGCGGAAEIVGEELRSLIEELADATEELAEVEDTMMRESDKALLAFRRCDGELTLRVERLLDRCASFMDIESRLASRSISHISESTVFRRKQLTRGGLH